MKEYQVQILQRAQNDLLEIKNYISKDSPNAAVALVDRLLTRMDSLSRLPSRGAEPRDAYLRSKGYRFLVEGAYLIFYKVGTAQVRIHRVIHGKRAYRKLL